MSIRKAVKRGGKGVLPAAIPAALTLALLVAPPSLAAPQFSFSFTADLTTVRPGDTPVLTVQFENPGPQDVPALWANLTFPPGLQYLGDDSGQAPAEAYSWEFHEVEPGALTFHVMTRLGSAVDDGAYLEVQALLAVQDPDSGVLLSFSRTVLMTVTRPVIAVGLSQDRDDLAAGEILTHTVSFDNVGSDAAKEVWVRVTLPPALALAADSATEVGATKTGTTSWKFSSVTPGDHAFKVISRLKPGSLEGTPLPTAVHLDYTSPGGASLAGSSARVTATASAPAMVLTKTVSRETVHPGDALTYAITLSNDGSDVAPLAWLNDTLPAGVAFASSDPAPASVGPEAVGWVFEQVSPGTLEVAVRLTVHTDLEGGEVLANTATLVYLDRSGHPMEPVTAEAETLVSVGPSITVSVTADRATVQRGDPLTFTVKYDNLGAEPAAVVWINNTIPEWATYVGAEPLLPNAIHGRDLKWRLENVAVGLHRIQIQLRIAVDAPEGAFITDMVSLVYTDAAGAVMNPSFASAVRVVYVPKPDIRLELVAPSATPPGSQVEVRLTVTNAGDGPASEVWLNLSLPSGVTVVADTVLSGGGHRWSAGRYHLEGVEPGTASYRLTLAVPADIPLGTFLTLEATAVYTDVDGRSYVAPTAGAGVDVAAPDAMPAVLTIGGTAALATLVAAVAANRESTKLGLFLLFAPLYTKLKREQILDHETRGMIRGYVVANPGDHFNAIKASLGLTNGTLAYHLRVLEREKILRSKKDGKFRRFYPFEMRVSDNGEPTEIQRTILGLIEETPGISQKDIASFLGVTQPTVNYHIERLKELGTVRVERRGIRVFYYRRRR